MVESNIVRIIDSDFQSIIEEIIEWKNELDGDLIDSIVNETLETVLDIIFDNSECEPIYENT